MDKYCSLESIALTNRTVDKNILVVSICETYHAIRIDLLYDLPLFTKGATFNIKRYTHFCNIKMAKIPISGPRLDSGQTISCCIDSRDISGTWVQINHKKENNSRLAGAVGKGKEGKALF